MADNLTGLAAIGLRTRILRSIFALALLFALEALMFYTRLADQILPYFPRAYDQTVYTVETYQLIDQFRTHGWSVFLHRIIHPDATGLSFTIQGALLSLVGGANRRALVSLNFIYFISLQVCLFLSVRSRTENTAPAWLALALLLSAGTHFDVAGGLYDYRIDYSALCLYGIFCSLLIVRAASSTATPSLELPPRVSFSSWSGFSRFFTSASF